MSAEKHPTQVHAPGPAAPPASVPGEGLPVGSRGRRLLGIAVALVALALVIIVFFLPGERLEGRARSGEIDASSVGDAAIVLAGEWKVLEDSQRPSAAGGFAFLPAAWAKPYGYAAYRLRVRGLDPARSYALSVSYLDTSYRLWIDGALALSGGSPGRSPAETRSAYRAGLARVPAGKAEIELRLEIANYVHVRGGPFRGILLGDEAYLRRYDGWSFTTELLTMAIMLFLAGIALMSAILRKSRSSLWYALMCVSGAAGLFALTPDIPIFRVFPGLGWDAYVRLAFSLVYLTPLWFFLAARSLFGGVSTRNAAFLSLPAAILAALALILPPRAFTAMNPVYLIDGLVLCALAAVVFGRAVIKSYPHSRPLSLGFAIFLGIALGVILFSNDRIYRGSFSVLSFLYPLFGQTPSSSFALDVASYVLALIGLNAFSVVFFIDAPKLDRPSPAMSEAQGKDRVRAKCQALGLSPRETEVALLALEGKRNKEIAQVLFVSENTVKTHMAKIFGKAGVKARSELFAFFSRD